jgi:hypothetical protein
MNEKDQYIDIEAKEKAEQEIILEELDFFNGISYYQMGDD